MEELLRQAMDGHDANALAHLIELAKRKDIDVALVARAEARLQELKSVQEARATAAAALRQADTVDGLETALAIAAEAGLGDDAMRDARGRLCQLLSTTIEAAAVDEPALQAALDAANRPELEAHRRGSRELEAVMSVGGMRLAELKAELARRRERQAAGVGKPQMPSQYMCPITHEPMRDPVAAADGFTYERTNIEQWLRGHGTSPMTNKALPGRNLVPNTTLRSLIMEFPEAEHKRLMAVHEQLGALCQPPTLKRQRTVGEQIAI